MGLLIWRRGMCSFLEWIGGGGFGGSSFEGPRELGEGRGGFGDWDEVDTKDDARLPRLKMIMGMRRGLA